MLFSAALRHLRRTAAVLATLAALAGVAFSGPRQESDPVLVFSAPDGSRPLESVERLAVQLPPGTEEWAARVVFSVDGVDVCAVEAPPFECSWDFGPDGAARVIRAVLELEDDSRLVARVHTPMRTGIRFRALVERVMVPVIVTDRRGSYIGGLTEDSFVVVEDGVPQDVTYFEGAADRSKLDLAVAIDISGSMAPVMPRLKSSVKALLESLRPDDVITLLAFNQRTWVLTRQESDRSRLASLIDRLQPSGFTSLYDAIAKAMESLDQDNARKAVLAFTDGEDRSSFRSLESVERQVADTGAPLYVVTLGPNSETEETAEVVERLATVSGGVVFRADEPEELDRALQIVRENVRNAYFLGYSPALDESEAAAGAERLREIRVRVRGGSQYRIQARTGYRR